MEEEVLKRIKREYEMSVQKQVEYKMIRKRLKELEKDKVVKEYLALLEMSQSDSFEKILETRKADLIEPVFRQHLSEIRETNGIYVYMGTFCNDINCDIEHGSDPIRLCYDNEWAEWREYQNIEQSSSLDRMVVPIKDCVNFEKTHSVIFLRGIPERQIYSIQKSFFLDACLYGQEKAVKRVLKKNVKN